MTSAKGTPSPYKMACKEDHFFDGNYVYQVTFQTCCTNNSSDCANNPQPLQEAKTELKSVFSFRINCVLTSTHLFRDQFWKTNKRWHQQKVRHHHIKWHAKKITFLMGIMCTKLSFKLVALITPQILEITNNPCLLFFLLILQYRPS